MTTERRPEELTDEEWRQRLTSKQYHVLREKGTDRPFEGEFTHPVYTGLFRCAACSAPLFETETQFDSGCGWPSFTQPVEPDLVALHEDTSHNVVRIEVTCRQCGGHLGHVFDDGPGPTGQRWCINSTSLDLDSSN